MVVSGEDHALVFSTPRDTTSVPIQAKAKKSGQSWEKPNLLAFIHVDYETY
jgi:hypothetical protein